jgi:xanthine dehydrogenase accessory factor
VEGAVIEEALTTIRTRKPKLLHFGIADDTAWEVGLACGGEIDIFIQPFEEKLVDKISSLINNDLPFSYSFTIDGPESKLGQMCVQEDVIKDKYPGVIVEKSKERKIKKFISTVHTPPSLIIVGGVHITINLAQIAKLMDYQVVVIDPRKSFAKENRFPKIDQLITSWPDKAFKSLTLTSNTAVVTLSHDPKIDDPALLAALDSPVFYIGALGSKKTHSNRIIRLNEHGCSEDQINRIKSPVGIEIGSQSPAEIALAVMAEVVRVKSGCM